MVISGLTIGGMMITYLKLFQDRKVEYGLSMTSDLYEQMDVWCLKRGDLTFLSR